MATSAPATVTLTVCSSRWPTLIRIPVRGQTMSVNAPSVLATDPNADGGALTATLVTGTGGQLTLNPNGSFSYTPDGRLLRHG